MDRLALDAGADRRDRRAACATIAALPDPVGEVIDGHRLPNGLDVRKVRVPLGVVAVVYEARPNVTIDAAALCLKSGNAIVLRGSSSAAHSNAVLATIAREAADGGLPAGAVALVAGGGREELAELAAQEGVVDLIIPRGGEGLKKALQAVATVPGHLRRVGQLPRLRRRLAPTSTRAEAIVAQRQDAAARASATRPRRCSCTPTSPRAFLPRRAARAARGRRRAARRRRARARGRPDGVAWPRPPRRTARRSSSRSSSR